MEVRRCSYLWWPFVAVYGGSLLLFMAAMGAVYGGAAAVHILSPGTLLRRSMYCSRLCCYGVGGTGRG
eukprot:3934832-Rhodomonas_salina.2